MHYFEHRILFESVEKTFSQKKGKDYSLQAVLLLGKLLSNLYYQNIKIEKWSPPYTKEQNDQIQASLLEKAIISKQIDQYSSLTDLYFGLTYWGEDYNEVFLHPCKSIFVDILRWYFTEAYTQEEDALRLQQILDEQNISDWYQQLTPQEFEALQTKLQKMDKELEEEINEQHMWGVGMHAIQQSRKKD